MDTEQVILDIATKVVQQYQGSSFSWTSIEVPLVRRLPTIDLYTTPMIIDTVLLCNGYTRMHGKPEFRNVFYVKLPE